MRRPSPYPLETHDYWIVSDAAAKLTQYASIVGSRYIADMALRGRFKREMAYYAKRVVDAVGRGEISSEEGLRVIEAERKSLFDRVSEFGAKSAGLIAGTLQVATGAVICYGSAMTLCAIAGVPMMAHGANNMYENGRNLWEERSNTEGPVRKGYQMIAKTIGGQERHGNIAYGSTDILLSIYGMWRMVLKPGAWRLFRYTDSDKIRSYKTMGAGPIIFEVGIDTLTGEQVYGELNK